MSSKNRNKTYSLRRRMAELSLATGSCILLVATVAILTVSYFHLTRSVRARIDRLADDLQAEYAEYGETERFFDCMREDAEEHNPELTFLVLAKEDGTIIRATETPDNILNSIRNFLSKGRKSRRLFTNRTPLHDEHVAIWLATRNLPGDRVIIVAHDATSTEHFFFFLSAVLGTAFLLTTLLAPFVSWLLGVRLMHRLNAIAETARKIEAGDWTQRVETTTRIRELRVLSSIFNSMCDKNERTLCELKMLTDNLAHDLRTPLARLRMAAEADIAGEAHEPLADTVADETGNMLNLINVMLEISQTEESIDRTPRTELDLAALVKQTADLFLPLAEQNGLKLEIRTPSAPVPFHGHRAKIQQLLGNMTENAVKYTPRGGRIGLTIEDDPSSPTIAIVVSDTGCGIPPDAIAHIFQRFWRADSSRHLPGNGLGLALVKAIVTSYGGTIACESEVRKGTRFTVRLPR